MTKDIRDKSYISHEDIIELNFIRKPGVYAFRKHHKQGLRSQIMEVLDPDDVINQNRGEIINGILFFPWAMPLKMLRIFRTGFDSLKDVFEEIRKLKTIEKYLPSDSYAKSDEFIVDYIRGGERDCILCGLQEFVEGKVLNPWDLAHKNHLENFVRSILDQPPEIVEKMVEGRMRKFYEESVLLKQVFVIDGERSIEKVLADAEKDVGAPVSISSYVCFKLGEGVEREETPDFAAEVAAAVSQS